MEHATSTTGSTISSAKVEGTNVYSLSGDKLGSIHEIVIDKVSGHVRYAELEFGGFLGMGTDVYPLPWGKLKYDLVKDGYVVDVSKDQLDKAPKYPVGDDVEYTEKYGRGVYDYYDTPWF